MVDSLADSLWWSTFILVWICLVTSVGIMIPQVIALHKNKYADNSSIWTYWIYFLCNLIWTIYQALYLIWRVKFWDSYDNPQPPTRPEIILLSIQLVCDILTSLLGVYLIIIKYYYLNVLKKIGKEKLMCEEKIQHERNLSFTKKNIYLINQQYIFFYHYNQQLCKRIIGRKSFASLSLKAKINKLIKISKKINKDFGWKQSSGFYTKNNKSINQFIINYKKAFPKKHNNIITNMKITNSNLNSLSYENKLKIAFIQASNLI